MKRRIVLLGGICFFLLGCSKKTDMRDYNISSSMESEYDKEISKEIQIGSIVEVDLESTTESQLENNKDQSASEPKTEIIDEKNLDIPIELLKVFEKGGVFYGEDGLRYNIDTYRVKDHEESKLVWKEYALINFGTPESKGLLVKCSPENMRTVWYIIFYSMNLEVFAYEVPFEVVQVLGDGLFQARDTFGYYTIEDNKLIDHVVIWWDLDRKEYIQQDGRTPCYDEIIMEHGYSLNFTPF